MSYGSERVKTRHGENEQESIADSRLINNARQRPASSVPGSEQPELRQTRGAGFWRGTGGTARWDERKVLYDAVTSTHHLTRSNFPSGLVFTHTLCSVTFV